MPHWIRGFVVDDENLVEIGGRYVECARAVPLRCGVAFLPITEDLAAELALLYERASEFSAVENVQNPPDVFLQPAEVLFAWRVSREFLIAYIETDYHGGTGQQFAAVWSRGRLVQTPSLDCRKAIDIDDTGPINRALAHFAVQSATGLDRFATVGLTWYRDLCEFENPQSPYYEADYLDRRFKEYGM